MFGDNISVVIYYKFLDYRPHNGSDYTVEGSIMQRALLYGLVETVLTCLEEWEMPGEHRQKRVRLNVYSHVNEVVS